MTNNRSIHDCNKCGNRLDTFGSFLLAEFSLELLTSLPITSDQILLSNNELLIEIPHEDWLSKDPSRQLESNKVSRICASCLFQMISIQSENPFPDVFRFLGQDYRPIRNIDLSSTLMTLLSDPKGEENVLAAIGDLIQDPELFFGIIADGFKELLPDKKKGLNKALKELRTSFKKTTNRKLKKGKEIPQFIKQIMTQKALDREVSKMEVKDLTDLSNSYRNLTKASAINIQDRDAIGKSLTVAAVKIIKKSQAGRKVRTLPWDMNTKRIRKPLVDSGKDDEFMNLYRDALLDMRSYSRLLQFCNTNLKPHTRIHEKHISDLAHLLKPFQKLKNPYPKSGTELHKRHMQSIKKSLQRISK